MIVSHGHIPSPPQPERGQIPLPTDAPARRAALRRTLIRREAAATSHPCWAQPLPGVGHADLRAAARIARVWLARGRDGHAPSPV